MFFKSISLTNFGPYKGEQRIEFPSDAGVSIIYGENRRGKTTLLNAIRYALFGKVITRGDRLIALHQIGNWEAAAEEAKYGFKVVLAFEHAGANYELTREHRPRAGVTRPETDLDYQQDCFLRKDTVVLGPDQRDVELSRIMPETVSRFFLFDGELLQQYEELLRDESEMGRNIKVAIERILGVPVLTNGRADLSELFKDAQNREAKAAQKNQKTQSLGNQHEALLGQRDSLQSETNRLKGELESLRASKASREEELRKSERTRSLLDERAKLQSVIATAESRLREKEEKRSELLAIAWKGLLNRRIRAMRESLEIDFRISREDYQRAVLAADLAERLRKALDEDRCGSCGQELIGQARQRLINTVSEALPEGELASLETRMQQLDSKIVSLKQSESPSNVELMQEVQDAIDERKIEKATAEDRLAEIKDQTKDIDETLVRKMYSEYEKILVDMGILQEGIRKQDDALREINERIRKVEAEMAKFDDVDLENARIRKELYDRLRSLFSVAVDAYRDRLRDRVERDATALFLKLTSEPEDKGLTINQNYGLTILHKDGSTTPVRSAGAEHIVAISLMGALQRNAPLRGPIVMDSPFGRLDREHTRKVVETLPSMADQVMLLVYEAELEPERAREELRGNLRKEYSIVRRSARHSTIETIS